MTFCVYDVYILCMTKMIKLSPKDRDFFRLVSAAAVTNPFSDARSELDLKIAECPLRVSVEKRIERVKNRVRERVARLQIDGKADITLYHGEERVIMPFTALVTNLPG